ncbi:hypothetical protein U9M48_003361 [Paspalum notatum var. saurae]|uniref:Uncharacterized protein n=1 Tax=Paspalum notatum var. saurae TaxID=547442 RepID=A0AAQ3PHA2_PASNO
MVLAEPEVWPRLTKAHPKVAKFRNKPFPLFYLLEGLYEGSVATRELNFTSTAADLAPPSAPSSRSASEQSLNPLSTNSLDLDGQETTSVLNLSTNAQSVPANPFNTNEPSGAQFVPSNPESRQGEGGSGRKHKQSHVGSALETEEKSYALELFESATNREIFLTTMEHNVREIWLRRKIRLLRSSDAWPPQHMM